MKPMKTALGSLVVTMLLAQSAQAMYHARLGRFMQRDPLALMVYAGSGYIDGMSLYEYAKSNTPKYGDPMGHKANPPAPTPAYAGPYGFVSYQEQCGRGGFCWRYKKFKNCVDCYAVDPCPAGGAWEKYATVCGNCARNPGPAPQCPPYVPQRADKCCGWRRNPTSRSLCKACCIEASMKMPDAAARKELVLKCEEDRECSKLSNP